MRTTRPAITTALALLAWCAGLVPTAVAQDDPKRLTLLHTNDIQSRLLGFAPNADYTPLTLNDDATVGGIARLATVVRERRAAAPERTLVLDGGDFMMGTLFQTLGESHAVELRLMQRIGYDAAALGNHEFDFRSDGLARIVEAGLAGGSIPRLLLSNIEFDPEDPGDDALARLFDDGVLQRSAVIERNGLRVGLFGILGVHAAGVSSYARPATFSDPVAAAHEMVETLAAAGAEVIVCLSHGGVWRPSAEDPWRGEDVELARLVPGIDVVIGGHSHTPLPEPILVDGRPVVQAGADGRFVGALELEVAGGRARVVGYELIPIDDAVAAAPDVHAEVERYQVAIGERVLAPHGLAFDQLLAETSFELAAGDQETATAGDLGALVADAMRWGVDRHAADPRRPETRTDVALITAGLIRDTLRPGASGRQATSDLFRVLPLGIGNLEPTPGYPLARVYVTGAELKSILEILSIAYRVRGSNYYPHLSGLRFRYHPYRVPLDRVYSVELEQADGSFREIDLAAAAPELYSLGLDAYVLSSIGLIDQLSSGLLEVVPKNAAGEPLADLDQALLDVDPAAPGVQESKAWVALVDYLRQLPDTDGDGLPEIPERYRGAAPRMIAAGGWQPWLLLRNATRLMWGASLVALLLLSALILGLRFVLRRLRHRA